MRALRIWGYCLLLLSLLSALGCNCKLSNNYTPKQCKVHLDQCAVVEIDNCPTDSVDKTLLLVRVDDTVTWVRNDAHTYTINFPNNKPFSSATVFAGAPATVILDPACPNGNSTVAANCYYKYNLTQDSNSTACSDPGIRVVPPSQISFLLKAWICFKSFFVHGT
jgi:hypothetical protein